MPVDNYAPTVSLAEVAKLIGINRSRIYVLIDVWGLPTVTRTGPNGQRRLEMRLSDVIEFAACPRPPGRPPTN